MIRSDDMEKLRRELGQEHRETFDTGLGCFRAPRSDENAFAVMTSDWQATQEMFTSEKCVECGFWLGPIIAVASAMPVEYLLDLVKEVTLEEIKDVRGDT